MAQQPLKSFYRPIMSVSLSNSILIRYNMSDTPFYQIKLLNENKLIICALRNLHYEVSREKLEPEPGFTSFCGQIEVRQAVGWQVLALNVQ